MKNLIIIIIISLLMIGCKQTSATNSSDLVCWEYQVLHRTQGYNVVGKDAFKSTLISVNMSTLDSLGNEGWELISVYIETETAYPNFGDAKKHTGIKTNTRPARLSFVFKRQKSSRVDYSGTV